MADLLESYLAARGDGASVNSPSFDRGVLAAVLAETCRKARSAHPDLQMDETAFATHLAKCGAPLGPSEERMELHAGDLYLCCAAIAGGPDAVKKLR